MAKFVPDARKKDYKAPVADQWLIGVKAKYSVSRTFQEQYMYYSMCDFPRY